MATAPMRAEALQPRRCSRNECSSARSKMPSTTRCSVVSRCRKMALLERDGGLPQSVPVNNRATTFRHASAQSCGLHCSMTTAAPRAQLRGIIADRGRRRLLRDRSAPRWNPRVSRRLWKLHRLPEAPQFPETSVPALSGSLSCAPRASVRAGPAGETLHPSGSSRVP